MEAHKFLLPDKAYGDRNNLAVNDGLFHKGIWNGLVFNEASGLID